MNRFAVAVLIAVAGCGGAKPEARGTAPTLGFEPNGIAWDARGHRLVIASGVADELWSWTDGEVALIAKLDDDPKGGLGQPVVRDDGTIVVTKFGGGDAGAVIAWTAAGGARPVAGLSASRRRIGLAAGGGALYVAWFEKTDGAAAGAISRVDLDGGGETDVLLGLGKAVGVAVIGETIYASDQSADAIVASRAGGPATTLAAVAHPDLLAVLPDGALVTSDGDARIVRVGLDGAVTTLAEGFGPVRGVAVDLDGGRLFVAGRDGRIHAVDL